MSVKDRRVTSHEENCQALNEGRETRARLSEHVIEWKMRISDISELISRLSKPGLRQRRRFLHPERRKGVVIDEMLRGVENQHRSGDSRIEQPFELLLNPWAGKTEPGELKDLSSLILGGSSRGPFTYVFLI
ncbi:Vacuolar protein sorting-associated protein-like protein [Capsicum annuum]|uniref:Uncharacterized protein n=1 Tax=Capsicum annuum TaxID=4072 RepID=A0A2G2Y8E0_CAPAN|nr:Vacuolar protein sorting-associated protein-like protein [Capsicum annuum]KAF3651913.1 Vacuolar protein sorting-associated protein-like protein [Capsicum annuum]PHT66010.1 hypothetical protein T459_30435 [Capsicum annuum]